MLALGEGYQQVLGGGAVRLVNYSPHPALPGAGAMSGVNTSHNVVGHGYLGSQGARFAPYPQAQVQMPPGGARKYLRLK